MTPDFNDYTPIVEQGTIEKSPGILGRRKRRESLGAVGHGYERVFVDRNGVARGSAGYTTAGEHYWATSTIWLKVDIADHELTFPFSFRSVDGTAGYDIVVAVAARVVDAPEVVRRNVTGVHTYVLPALSTRVDHALGGALGQAQADTVATLNAGCDQVRDAIKRELAPGTSFTIGEWLSVTVITISVSLDSATETHYNQLVGVARTAELDITRLRHQEVSARAEIDLRTTWSQYLEPRLGNPLSRAVETIAADPTQDNINRVVSQLDANDQWTRTEVVAILNKLIDKDFVGDIDELQAIKVIVEGLQRSPSSASNAQVGPAAQAGVAIERGEILSPADDDTSRAKDSHDIDRDWHD